MTCSWTAESVFRPPCPAEAGDATSLRGVNLDETSVGDPDPAAVLQFDGSSYVATTSVTLPGLLGYGGEGGGPQILTAENTGTFSASTPQTVLVLDPPDSSTIDIAFTLHAKQGTPDEVGIFRMYAAFMKASGTLTMIGTPDATSTKLTSGPADDGWTCDIQVESNRITVIFDNASASGGDFSISAQYSLKTWA